MAALPAYKSRRQARLRWLPSIPGHWDEQRAKVFFHEVDERSRTGHEELLSVSHITGITPRSQKNVTMFKAASYVGSKLCRRNDIVINTLWAWMAALGVSRYDGIVSPAYAVYRARKPDAFHPAYLDYLLRTQAYVSEYKTRSTGIRSSRLRLYPDQFLDISLLCPPRTEQDQIVAYLRAQDARIARFIAAKRRLIALLTEQKLTIIDHAVTRGLDPVVKLKPSGVEWLGQIPEHWCAKKLKFVSDRIVGGSTPKVDEPSYWGGRVVWITPSDISKTSYLTGSERTLSQAGLNSCSTSVVPAGSAIVTSRAPVGNVALAKVDLCTNQGCKAIVPKDGVLQSTYLFLLLQRMKVQLQMLANGTTFTEISTWDLANEFAPIPSLSEQHAICSQVNADCQPIEHAIDGAKQEIRLIREYRERQIADVVTGQVDVRGWQPGPDDLTTDAALASLADDDAIPPEGEDTDDDT